MKGLDPICLIKRNYLPYFVFAHKLFGKDKIIHLTEASLDHNSVNLWKVNYLYRYLRNMIWVNREVPHPCFLFHPSSSHMPATLSEILFIHYTLWLSLRTPCPQCLSERVNAFGHSCLKARCLDSQAGWGQRDSQAGWDTAAPRSGLEAWTWGVLL